MMDTTSQVVDTWIFEYLSHKCVKGYFENECNSALLQQDIALGVLTHYLNESKGDLTRRDYVCLLFLHLLCMEESIAEDGDQANCYYVGTDDFRKSMPQQIAFASRDSKSDSTKRLARNCLIETHVVIFKHCLKKGDLWEIALKEFDDFVNLMPVNESKEAYDKCAKMKRVDPNDDFISEYMELIRHLVLTMYSELDVPYLIKLAQTQESDCDLKELDTGNQKMRCNSTKDSDMVDETQVEGDESTEGPASQKDNGSAVVSETETGSISSIISDKQTDMTELEAQKNELATSGSDSDSEIIVMAKRNSKSMIVDSDSNQEVEAKKCPSYSSRDYVVISDSVSDSEAPSTRTNSMITSNTDVASTKAGSISETLDPKDVFTFRTSESEDDTSPDRMTSELKVLLRDTRPSRESDLEEITLEESDAVTKIRKKAEKFNIQNHLNNAIELQKRIRMKPPAHQNIRGGPWMVEEETAFIRKTLRFGVGKWKKIKDELRTFRSTQQLKDKWRILKQWQIDEVKKTDEKS